MVDSRNLFEDGPGMRKCSPLQTEPQAQADLASARPPSKAPGRNMLFCCLLGQFVFSELLCSRGVLSTLSSLLPCQLDYHIALREKKDSRDHHSVPLPPPIL